MLQAPPRRKSRPDLVFYKTPLNPSRIFSQNTLSWIAIQIFFRKPLNRTGVFSQNPLNWIAINDHDPNIFIKPPKTVNHLQYGPSCSVPPIAHIPGRRRRVIALVMGWNPHHIQPHPKLTYLDTQPHPSQLVNFSTLINPPHYKRVTHKNPWVLLCR